MKQECSTCGRPMGSPMWGSCAKCRLSNAPIGTRAPAIMGGSWIKTAHGWKWCTGSTFPRPGGDWTGELVPPEGGPR